MKLLNRSFVYSIVNRCLIALVLCARISSSAADYLQKPGHFGGFGSDGGVITVADDFQFPQNTLLGSLNWWGGYFNPPPGPDNFTIRLYTDIGGQPGWRVSGFTLGSITKQPTANFVNPGLYPEFRYSANLLSPFEAQAGVRYWLSIVNPPRDIWLWEASASALNPGVQRSFDGVTWQPYFDNTAFELVGVPEPDVRSLVMAGILIAARRRANQASWRMIATRLGVS
jgi:hypothetical protein